MGNLARWHCTSEHKLYHGCLQKRRRRVEFNSDIALQVWLMNKEDKEGSKWILASIRPHMTRRRKKDRR